MSDGPEKSKKTNSLTPSVGHQVERLYRLCLQLQASVSELHLLVQEWQAVAGGRQTGELRRAVSRLTSSSTGSFYDPDSEPDADMWSATSEKKFYEKVDQSVDEHPLQALQALEQRKAEVGTDSGLPRHDGMLAGREGHTELGQDSGQALQTEVGIGRDRPASSPNGRTGHTGLGGLD